MRTTSGANRENVTREIPDWEREFWSFVRNSDDVGCHVYKSCESRQNGLFCLVDNMQRIIRLRSRQMRLEGYCSLEPIFNCRLCELVKKLAGSYLGEGGIYNPPVPEDIIPSICHGHRIEVRTLPLKKYHGAVWHIGSEWVVHLNSNDTPARRRFSLFHEYFHILAGCNTSAMFNEKKLSSKYLVTEILADTFAGNMLVPLEWLRQNYVKFSDPKQIAEFCDVPRQVVRVMLSRNGLMTRGSCSHLCPYPLQRKVG